MKKKILLCMCALLAFTACGKKEVKEDNNINIVDENVVSDEEDKKENNSIIDNIISKDEEESDAENNEEIVIIEQGEIFSKFVSEDKKSCLYIQSDASNGEEIKGDCFTLLTKDNSKFAVCQVLGDQIMVNYTDSYPYYFAGQQLFITIDGNEYVFNNATDEEYASVADTYKQEKENLNIIQEEVVDSSVLEGAWVSSTKDSAAQITETNFLFVTDHNIASGGYVKDASTITLDDGTIFNYSLSKGVLTITNPETQMNYTLDKIKNAQFDDIQSEVYFGQ